MEVYHPNLINPYNVEVLLLPLFALFPLSLEVTQYGT